MRLVVTLLLAALPAQAQIPVNSCKSGSDRKLLEETR